MNDLFRFIALRAASRTNPKNLVNLSTDSQFQGALAGIHQDPPPNPSVSLPTESTTTTSSDSEPLARLRAATTRALVPASLRVSRSASSTTGDGPDPVAAARQIVEKFIHGDYGIGFISDTYDLPSHDAFDQLYTVATTATKTAALTTAIKSGFGKAPKDLVVDPAFKALVRNVNDTIVAIFIHPGAHSLPIADLARIARLMTLIARVAAGDTTLDNPGVIQLALTATLLLPTKVFPLRDGLPQPVGVGDLLVVKQQLKRYEPGDIANIENILRGETRKKVTRNNRRKWRLIARKM